MFRLEKEVLFDFWIIFSLLYELNEALEALEVVPRTKQYGLVFDKRVVDIEDFRSYPYGFYDAIEEMLDTLLEMPPSDLTHGPINDF